MGSIWAANFFAGPHIPSFLRCQVWGVPGLPTFRWTSYSLIFEVPGLGSTWSANFSLDLIFPYFWGPRFSLDLIFPYFWGARFGEYLVCQLFVGPHIPLFLRCQVWGVPGLPTFRWTLYSLIFEVPGLGSTWSANFSLDLIFPYFWGARFGEYLVCQLFVGPHVPLFLRCQVWGVPGLPIFIGTHIPQFLRCHIQGFRYCRFLSSIWLDVMLWCSRDVWHL